MNVSYLTIALMPATFCIAFGSSFKILTTKMGLGSGSKQENFRQAATVTNSRTDARRKINYKTHQKWLNEQPTNWRISTNQVAHGRNDVLTRNDERDVLGKAVYDPERESIFNTAVYFPNLKTTAKLMKNVAEEAIAKMAPKQAAKADQANTLMKDVERSSVDKEASPAVKAEESTTAMSETAGKDVGPAEGTREVVPKQGDTDATETPIAIRRIARSAPPKDSELRRRRKDTNPYGFTRVYSAYFRKADIDWRTRDVEKAFNWWFQITKAQTEKENVRLSAELRVQRRIAMKREEADLRRRKIEAAKWNKESREAAFLTLREEMVNKGLKPVHLNDEVIRAMRKKQGLPVESAGSAKEQETAAEEAIKSSEEKLNKDVSGDAEQIATE